MTTKCGQCGRPHLHADAVQQAFHDLRQAMLVGTVVKDTQQISETLLQRRQATLKLLDECIRRVQCQGEIEC